MVHQRHPATRLIASPVGLGGMNRRADVIAVQHLLNRAGVASHPLAEDGIAGPDTIGQIRAYQFRGLRFAHPDGRIDPDGHTLQSLLERVATRRVREGATAPAAPPALPTPPSPQQRTERAAAAALPDAHRRTASTQQLAAPGAAGAKLTEQDFVTAAARLGPNVEPAIVHAIADAESGGKSGFGPTGLPIIAYEGHIFRKYTKRAYDRTHPLLSYRYTVKAGPEWRRNNRDQTTAWATLTEAAALDSKAALMACSWGMFQVMGFNFQACGYRDVESFVAAMKAGERGQLEACIGYCRSRPGMLAAIGRKDFAGIAAAYNGEDYGDYDQRIRRAYLKHKG